MLWRKQTSRIQITAPQKFNFVNQPDKHASIIAPVGKGKRQGTKEESEEVKFTCTLLALLRKCLIMNGAGEGNRTLISFPQG